MDKPSLELLETLLNNIEDALYITDGKGNVLYANNAVIKAFKCSKSEYERLYANASVVVERGLVDQSIGFAVAEKKERITMVQQFIDSRGKTKLYHSINTPVFDENGEMKHAVGIMRPCSKIDESYEEIHSSNNKINVRLSSKTYSVPMPIYISSKMSKIIDTLNNIAETDVSVLLEGETGTGKEVLANYIHSKSLRNSKPMISINCAAITPSLFESEMFGYEKGSFTGAESNGKPGLIESANNGTLFLDEIDSMPLEQQGKLLRTLETKTVKRVGGRDQIKVNFRLIATTHQNLLQSIEEGTFRSDLYYRINIMPVTIPSLRERREDIRPLAESFLEKYCNKYNRKITFSEQLFQQLEQHDWPGNVRELRNIVERAVITSSKTVQTLQNIHIPKQKKSLNALENSSTPIIAKSATQEHSDEYLSNIFKDDLESCMSLFEKQLIEDALKQNTSIKKAAQSLGISLSTISRKISKYGLSKQ